MNITFNHLCEYFTSKTKNVYFNSAQGDPFIDVDLVTGKEIMYLENYIYIGYTSTFKGSMDKISNACFILLNDDSTILGKYINNNLRIIELNENEDILEIYNEVRAFFRRDVIYNKFKVSLLESLLAGDDLNKIIATASKLIGNPLIVIDLSFKVLASSALENITDLLWMDNVKKGYCSYEFIAELKKLDALIKGRKTERPFEVTCPVSPTKKVVFKIVVKGKTVGNKIGRASCRERVS